MANKPVLTRIDSRLLHGQTGVRWAADLRADAVIVADDDVAADSFRQHLMKMAAPASAKTLFLTLEDAAAYLKEADADQRIFVLTASPENALTLAQKGMPLGRVNVGNLCMGPGKENVTPVISLSKADKKAFGQLRDMGADLFIQRIPNGKEEDVQLLFQ